MKRIWISSLLLVAACGHGPSVPPVRWSPPFAYHEIPAEPWYQAVWDSTVACIAETKPVVGDGFANTHWFVVDGLFTYILPNGDGAVANWDPFNRIYVSQTLHDAAPHWVIAHEIIHAAAHIYDHPVDPFDRCLRRMYPLDFPNARASIILNDMRKLP